MQVFKRSKSAANRRNCTFPQSCTIRNTWSLLVFGRWSTILYTVKNQSQNMSSKMPKFHIVARCSVSKHVCVSMLKHKRAVASSVERLTSGAFGANACCIFLSMSLFTSLFFWFLSYIKCYLSNKEKEQKNNNLLFLCIMAYVNVFWRKLFCAFFSFLCRKKWACCLLNLSTLFILLSKKRFSV